METGDKCFRRTVIRHGCPCAAAGVFDLKPEPDRQTPRNVATPSTKCRSATTAVIFTREERLPGATASLRCARW
jgi:hypothetical protein